MNNFNLLFDSGSLEVADLNNAFWLTSGYLTPMYINTHYICGGSQKSKEILALIDSEYKQDKDFLVKLKQIFTDVYITDNIYKTAIDKLVQHLKPIIKDLDISMIAGGARRDWFFSVLAAEQLNIPHVYIDKELNITDISDNQVLYLSNQRILNIADLLMLGTSCVNYWKPAIEKLNGNLVGSISIVNRMQGGSENLERNNIKSISSLIEITPDFFKSAKDSWREQ